VLEWNPKPPENSNPVANDAEKSELQQENQDSTENYKEQSIDLQQKNQLLKKCLIGSLVLNFIFMIYLIVVPLSTQKVKGQVIDKPVENKLVP
jgi:uncharacterized ion transporter superfamily protein YfcC